MPNWLGDMIMATPILNDLRKNFPKAKITAFCKKPLSDLIKNDKNIDEVFSFEKPLLKTRHYKKKILKKLKEKKYDLGILLTNSFSSAYLFFKGKVKNILGYDTNFRKFFLDYRIKFYNRKNTHLVDTYKRLLLPLKINLSDSKPKIYLDEKEMEKRALLFKKENKIVGICPFSNYGKSKCWPLERFEKVAEKLLDDKNISVIFLGEKKDKKNLKIFEKNRVFNLIGKTDIQNLAYIISICDVVLTNDSGPMHLAASLDIPLVALFGSTDEIVTGPYLKNGIIKKKTACSPCFKRKCFKDFLCMKKIEIDEVLNEVKKKIYVQKIY
ncbi:MAG: hypothetical protein AMS24_03695 [Chlamydiae bacterium SM23_39]|nr:MAG: hypothetical protein AMS24_03695 [Chlamydiae bacterium SM23_39]